MRTRKNPERPSGYLGLFLALLALFALTHWGHHGAPAPLPDPGDTYVQAEGEVRNAGVYAFRAPPGLMALVRAAGGLKGQSPGGFEGRDASFPSGTLVLFHSRGGTAGFALGEISAFHKLTLGIPISLNRETEMGLTALPGIGPALARAIVRERSRRGGFSRLEDVVEVKGVGPRMYRKIAPLLHL